MDIYFDNSATTFVTESVCKVVTDVMTKEFGNPSSKHMKGVEAERILREARETIARTLKCSEKEIFFTSGATESNNWAIFGGVSANQRAGKHIITTTVEHASVLMPFQHLAEQGYRVTHLPVDEKGHISLEDLKEALSEDTILVSIMAVNNEVGALEPVEEAAKIVKAYNPSILFHVDAVQAYGKMQLRPKKWGIDMLSCSGHKLHAPKGTGFLFVKEKTKLNPFILGGGQQGGMRSGTDNVPGAAGLAQAAKDCYQDLAGEREQFTLLKNRLIAGLHQLEDVRIVCEEDDTKGVPWIVSASFPGARSEVLLHSLEDRGIYVSSGSACSSNKKLPVSSVLTEMHLPPEQLESTLRFSFSRYNTIEEVDQVLSVLGELLPMLRRYTRH